MVVPERTQPNIKKGFFNIQEAAKPAITLTQTEKFEPAKAGKETFKP